MSQPVSMMPLAGMDNASRDDAALQVGGQERRLYLRDALNVDILDTRRAAMRPGLRKVTGQPLCDLWQSSLHGGVFGTLGSQWVKVKPADWSTQPLADIGAGVVSHLDLNGMVLAAGPAGIFQYNGQAAQRFTLDTPPAPLVSAGSGSLEPGAYGVALAWLRGALESPLSAMAACTVGQGGALDITLPLCLDATVTGMRLYLTRQNGGELLRAEDHPAGAAAVSVPLLPRLGAAAQFQHMQPMPTGQYLGLWRGRLVTAQGRVLRFSEALAYHLHDPRHGFVQMPQRITFVQPVDGGLWVGQVDHVAFLSGSQPNELTLFRKTAQPPVPGSAVPLDAQTAGQGAGAAVVAWLAGNGYVTGGPNGDIAEPQAGRLTGIAGQRGSTVVAARRLTTAVT